jgi:hypothetical protein
MANFGAWVGLVVLAGSWSPAHAQSASPAELLRWNFKTGDTLRYTMVQEIAQETKLPDRDLKSTVHQTLVMRWSVKNVSSEGVADMTWTIERVRSKVDGPDGGFEFDSQTGKVAEGPLATQLTPFVKPLVGAEFSLKMNGRGQYSDVKVPQKLVESLRQGGPGAPSGGMFAEDGLKNQISQMSLAFPEGPLERGKSWSNPSRFPVPMIGTVVLDRKFIFQGPDPKAADLRRVSLETKMSLEPAADSYVTVKIASAQGQGEFVFDAQAGRILSSRVTDKLQMSFAAQGQTSEQMTDTVTTVNLTTEAPSK